MGSVVFDAPLLSHATLVPNSAYVLRGDSSSTFEAFSKDAMAAIEVWPEAQPAILIEQKAGIRLENLQVFYYTFDDILYEAPMDPLLIIDTGNNLLEGAVLHDIVMADEVGSGEQVLPPLIRATGSRIHSVQISNSNIDSTLLTSGDPMMGLEVWSNRDGVHIGQARGYILYMPSGVVDTTTKLQPPQGRRSGERAVGIGL